jgi:hypothetical protein
VPVYFGKEISCSCWNLEFHIIQNNKQCSVHEGKKAEQSRVILISETKLTIKTNFFYAGISCIRSEYGMFPITLAITIADKGLKYTKLAMEKYY